ncbi:MAG: P-II family nitrogen regulator [Treponema sp.]
MTLLIGIVPRGKGELLTSAANEVGARGGTIIMCRGTESNLALQLFGLGDIAKDTVLILVGTNQTEIIRDAMIQAVRDEKKSFGVLFSVNVSRFIKSGITIREDNKMSGKTSYELITAIVNRGFADDVMAAARKAGAGGGTIINARGTAKEGDAKFFGMEIVPEKDMIMILADTEKSAEILEAIKVLPFLAKPGSGIVFSSPAENFTVLGKSKTNDSQ